MTKLRKRLFVVGIFCLIVGGLWLAGAGYSQLWPAPVSPKSPSAQPTRPLRVRLKWIHQAQFAGFYLAAEKGFFKHQGLDVTIEQGGPASNALTAVLSGAADVGVWSSEQVLVARAEGKPVKAIGVVYQQAPNCWMVRAESKINSFLDVTSEVVGVQSEGTDFDILYRALILRHNINRRRLNERQVDFNLTLFTSDQVQVWPSYSINEPFTMAAQGVQVRCMTPAASGLDFYGDTVLTSDNVLYEREDDLRSFMRAITQGWEYALGHTEEAVEMTLKQNKDLKKESQVYMLEQSTNLIRPAVGGVLRMQRSRWEAMEKMLVGLGIIKTPIADIDQAFTNALLPMPNPGRIP
jgi:NitT/TauT family transport system substrate-binding protein